MRKVRDAIDAGTFAQFRASFVRNYRTRDVPA
jgi:queuine/archaeosine tRNA-ribosyltransferase